MNNGLDFIIEHAEKELDLIGMKDLPVGRSIIDLIVKAGLVCNNETHVVREICNFLPVLLNGGLLSPITENDFVETVAEDGKGNLVKIIQCTRRDSVYKDPNTGEYYDERGICFINKNNPVEHKMYIYNEDKNSKTKIELPYFPVEKIVYLDSN
jgi:hypothetical protein